MKKIISFLILTVLILSLTGCGSGGNTSDSKALSVKGLFYAENIAPDYDPCLLMVFDYIPDNADKALPKSGSDVTLDISGNKYKALEIGDISLDTSFNTQYDTYHALSRYAGYTYALNSNDAVSEGKPIRMFVCFNLDSQALNQATTAQFSFGTENIDVNIDNVQKISLIDEVLKVEDNYDKAQSIAAFKWRVDKAYLTAIFAMKNSSIAGSALDPMGTAMETLFDENVNWGISICEIPWHAAGGNAETGYIIDNDAVNRDLSVFDRDIILEAYPAYAKMINAYIDTYNEINTEIRNPNADVDNIANNVEELMDMYGDFCFSLFNIEPLIY